MDALIASREAVLVDQRFSRLWPLLESVDGEVFLVGGALRCSLLADRVEPRDVDLSIDSGDAEALLLSIEEHFEVQRRASNAGTVILANGSKADIFTPNSFRPSCITTAQMLQMFDLNVNAVGVSLNSETVLDPLEGAADALAGRVTLTESRWTAASHRDAVHLLMRLAELLMRRPSISITNPECLLRRLPELDEVDDWQSVWDCHTLSRSEATSILMRPLQPAGVETAAS